jgi:hypothetical protein
MCIKNRWSDLISHSILRNEYGSPDAPFFSLDQDLPDQNRAFMRAIKQIQEEERET